MYTVLVYDCVMIFQDLKQVYNGSLVQRLRKIVRNAGKHIRTCSVSFVIMHKLVIINNLSLNRSISIVLDLFSKRFHL